MTLNSYVGSHALSDAFIANQLDQLAELIVAQGEALLLETGISIPPRAVSTLLLIGERGEISAADIAELLRQPHQVATQRITLLIDEGVIDRAPDPHDGRRKILKLTAKGRKQYQKLRSRLETAAQIFAALFDEIECDLSVTVRRAAEALTQRSLLERSSVFEKREPVAADRLRNRRTHSKRRSR